MYNFMFLRNRTKSADLPLQIRSGSNPGDVGHDWVMKRFIGSVSTGDLRDPYRIYRETIKTEEMSAVMTRQYIPSRVWDNPALPNREEYVAGIVSSMAQEDVQAYLNGRWDMLAGAMFKKPLLVLDRPTMMDSEYMVVRAIDHGIDDPTCVLWMLYYPAHGVVDVISELYLRETTLDGIVHYIKEREALLSIRPATYSVGSPEMQNRTAKDLQTIASMMGAKGVPVERANTDRLAGWTKIMDLIGKGQLRVWPIDNRGHGAPNLVRTLPKLQRNTGPGKNPNDIRNNQEDHAADALRYGVLTVYERPTVVTALERPKLDPSKYDTLFDKIVEEPHKMKREQYFPGLGNW